MVRKGILEDARCPWWICWTFDNPIRRLIHNSCDILCDLVKEGDTALDIGCGEGYFTVDIAKMVGESGRVFAVDLQEHMLKVLSRRAERAGLKGRIEPILGDPDVLSLPAPVDFVLSFWMLHEVPDKQRLLQEIAAAMKPGAAMLLVEPKWHVSKDSFYESVRIAGEAGLAAGGERPVTLSRAVVLQKKGGSL